MGQTIGWRKYDPATGKNEWDKGVPEWFENKWTGRFEWFQSLYSNNKIKEMPGNDEYLRPLDFNAARKYLEAIGDEEVISQHWPDLDMAEVRQCWKECTDYLEANPNVFVDYS